MEGLEWMRGWEEGREREGKIQKWRARRRGEVYSWMDGYVLLVSSMPPRYETLA